MLENRTEATHAWDDSAEATHTWGDPAEATHMQEKVYSTEMGDIHYWANKVEGSPVTLVFLPGLTADSHLFDKQVQAFSGTYSCIVWDPPAHGKSRPFQLRFTLLNWAQWLHGILVAEGTERPVLVGQSMGGYLSQMYMDEYPGEAAGFVCIDSAPLQRSYYSNWELAALKHMEPVYRAIPWKPLITWGSNGTATSEYGRALMRKTMQSYEKGEYCALAGWGFKILAEAVEEERPYEITCPVQLICGEKDGAGSAKSYNKRWAKKTGYPMAWIPGAGHNSNTDNPEMVNGLIEDLVRSL